MKNKIVEITHTSREEVLAAVQDFSNTYSSQGFSKSVKVFAVGDGKYIIEFENMDSEHFKYAVNYLRYPETKPTFHSVFGYDPNSKIMYFVPESDEEYDNCYSIDSKGKSLKHSFNGVSSEVESDQQYIKLDVELSGLEVISTMTGEAPVKKGFLSWLFG